MRNRYIDFIRFLAIIRVVVYHTTGWAFLSMVFPAMTVMFALAGSLMAASLDRSGPDPWLAGPAAVGRRLRRLLPSLWVFAACFVPAMLLTGLPLDWRLLLWLAPVADPPSNWWGALVTSPIWYLRDYLWFVLASPAALWLFRRRPLPTLLAPYVLLVVVELGWSDAPAVLRDFGLYFGAWLLGFAHHDGLLRRVSRRTVVGLAGVLGAAGAGWIFTHPGPRGFDLNDIPLGNGLWSAGFTLVLLALVPAGAAWVDRNDLVGRLVTLVNRRALTVYLWHMPVVIGLGMLAVRLGWDFGTRTGAAVHVLLVAALVGVAVPLFGWVEDLAARRRPVLLPGGPPVRAAGAVATPGVPVGAAAGPARVPGPRPAADRAGAGGRPVSSG
ncbi:acyltransferase family protein [Micromonospora zhanjiangensis]|uniref:Acyltransferase n=1 Tax=Micromonospora zhanjiangensis TaxID=1522057 RepID=A0ABV8KUS2_9ACTN